MPSPWETGGALRVIAQAQQWPTAFREVGLVAKNPGATVQALTRLWLTGTVRGTRLKLELETDGDWSDNARQRAGTSGWAAPNPGGDLTRWHLSHPWSDARYAGAATTLARLDATWSWRRLDFDLGRQPISLGTSHFISVLDVLAPFSPGYLDASYKPGVDALRIRTGMGTAGEAELLAVAAREPGAGAVVGRVRNSLDGIDVELLAGRFRRRNFAGLAWEGEKRKITWWGEIGAFERRPSVEGNRGGAGGSAISAVIGAEKEIAPKLRLGLAWFHQDFGVRDAADLPAVWGDAPLQEGWTFLGGADYGLITVHRELHPLVNADLSGLINAHDGSTLWQPKVSYSLGDNSDIVGFAWLSTGAGPQTVVPTLPPGFPAGLAPAPTLVPAGEFGFFPRGVGLIWRRFF